MLLNSQASGSLTRSQTPKLITWLEILAAWLLIEATIWSYGKIQIRLLFLSACFIVLSTLAHRPSLQELGLGRSGVRSTVWVIPAALMAAAASLLIAREAGTLHPLFGAARPSAHTFAYAVWAIFQQFILQSFFFLRLEKLMSTRVAAVGSAALFCLVHIPNPVLVIVCLVAGWLACEIFRRHRNIYALGIAHAILGITIAIAVPDNLHRHMRVGIGYYHYRAQAVLTPKG